MFISSLLIDHEEDFCRSDELEAHHAGLLNFAADSVDDALRTALNALIGLDYVHGFSENIGKNCRLYLFFWPGFTADLKFLNISSIFEHFSSPGKS